MLAFTIAVERWMEPDYHEAFPLHAAAALSDLPVRVRPSLLPGKVPGNS